MSQLNLLAREYYRILKQSRTVVDLTGSEEIQSTHLAEALRSRLKLMMDEIFSPNIFGLLLTYFHITTQMHSDTHFSEHGCFRSQSFISHLC